MESFLQPIENFCSQTLWFRALFKSVLQLGYFPGYYKKEKKMRQSIENARRNGRISETQYELLLKTAERDGGVEASSQAAFSAQPAAGKSFRRKGGLMRTEGVNEIKVKNERQVDIKWGTWMEGNNVCTNSVKSSSHTTSFPQPAARKRLRKGDPIRRKSMHEIKDENERRLDHCPSVQTPSVLEGGRTIASRASQNRKHVNEKGDEPIDRRPLHYPCGNCSE